MFPDNFHIVKYYFFGFLKTKWKFEKTDHLRIKSYGSDFGTKGDYADQDVSATELGCLFSILSIFMESEISKKEIRIERLSVIEKVISRVDIKVDIDEYKLLKGFVD